MFALIGLQIDLMDAQIQIIGMKPVFVYDSEELVLDLPEKNYCPFLLA